MLGGIRHEVHRRAQEGDPVEGCLGKRADGVLDVDVGLDAARVRRRTDFSHYLLAEVCRSDRFS